MKKDNRPCKLFLDECEFVNGQKCLRGYTVESGCPIYLSKIETLSSSSIYAQKDLAPCDCVNLSDGCNSINFTQVSQCAGYFTCGKGYTITTGCPLYGKKIQGVKVKEVVMTTKVNKEFLAAMQERLDEKEDVFTGVLNYKEMTLYQLIGRLNEAGDKLLVLYKDEPNDTKLREKLIDLANFCWMLWERLGEPEKLRGGG